tara:strand:+ start:5369 stop:6430 length:1062 start_codon:yes stop_codon:yes gene_type:complete
METNNRKIIFVLLAATLTGTLIYLSRRVLTPFMIAFTLAYLLDPLVDFLVEKKISRTAAVLLLIGSFFSLLLAMMILLFPVLQDQVERLAHNVPRYVETFQKMAAPMISQISLTEPGKFQEFLDSSIEKFGTLPLKAVSSASTVLWNSLSGLLNLLFAAFNLVVIPVAMFYLLRDYDEITGNLLDLIPPKHQEKTREIFLKIDSVLANFIRGQLMVSGVMGGLYSVGLLFCGTPLSLIIGTLAGLANLVPYLGIVLGFIPAGVLTYLHHQELMPVLGVMGVFGAVQVFEGIILTPRVVGNQIGLHPVTIMISVLLGAEFFGLLGVLLALPAAAVVNVLLSRGLDQYRNSSFYS